MYMDATLTFIIFSVVWIILFFVWALSCLIFIVCSFSRGVGWGLLCFFTGYIGGIFAVLVPGENKPMKSFLFSVIMFFIMIAVGIGGSVFLQESMEKELTKYVLVDGKLYEQHEGKVKELAPASGKMEETFRTFITQALAQSGKQSFDPQVSTETVTLQHPALPASTFKITAMMGQEGTQDFNIMFNNKYTVDVGESFEMDYEGRMVQVKLVEVTAKNVIVESDGHRIKIPRIQFAEAVEGDPAAAALDAGQGGGGIDSLPTYQPGKWLVNYSQAQKYAKEFNRPILLLFTGSDWCPPCMKLEKEVFSNPAFIEYAKENFILIKADFPRSHKLSASQQQANDALAREFAISGYPSVYLLTPSGQSKQEKMGSYRSDNLNIYLSAMKKFKDTL